MEVEVPPPGTGVFTITITGPALTTAFAGIAAVSWVEFTNVVGSACPPKETVDPATKFAPMIVNVNAPLPWITYCGEIDEMVGVGSGGLPVPD